VLTRVAASTGTWLARTGAIAAAVFVWFTFVAQIFIGEFFMYHPVVGWLNQPLVQLPWFHYIPSSLKNPMGEVFFAGLVIFVLLWIRCWLGLCDRQSLGFNSSSNAALIS
jgi:hypothetical protein